MRTVLFYVGKNTWMNDNPMSAGKLLRFSAKIRIGFSSPESRFSTSFAEFSRCFMDLSSKKYNNRYISFTIYIQIKLDAGYRMLDAGGVGSFEACIVTERFIGGKK